MMDDMICKSCKEEYKTPATHLGHPVDDDGKIIPGLDNWPLCDNHAIPHALVAGWKPEKIQAALTSNPGQDEAIEALDRTMKNFKRVLTSQELDDILTIRKYITGGENGK